MKTASLIFQDLRFFHKYFIVLYMSQGINIGFFLAWQSTIASSTAERSDAKVHRRAPKKSLALRHKKNCKPYFSRALKKSTQCIKNA